MTLHHPVDFEQVKKQRDEYHDCLVKQSSLLHDVQNERDAAIKQVVELQDDKVRLLRANLKMAIQVDLVRALDHEATAARRIVAMLAWRKRTSRRTVIGARKLGRLDPRALGHMEGEENEAHNAYELASRILRGIDL
jgi:hypothetical protein